MQDIIDTLREGGITKVPTIHNDRGPDGQYAMKGLGKVDLWVGYLYIIDLFLTLYEDTAGMGESCIFPLRTILISLSNDQIPSRF